MRQAKVCNLGYCLSDSHIFLIHGGESSLLDMDDPDVMRDFRSEIRVFDWNGEFVTSFMLDHNAVWIEYCESSKKMYCVDLDQSIFVYDLSDLLR